MKNKIISVFLSAALLAAFAPCYAASAHDMGGGGVYNTITAGAAIKNDGSLWDWGGVYPVDTDGDGEADEYRQRLPEKIMDDAVSVSEGRGVIAAIKSDGSLWMQGDNYKGQLGDGTRDASDKPEKIMEDVIAVSVGSNHTAAITSDGSLWMWGDNYYGEFCDGTTEGSLTPKKIMDNVAAVSAGNEYTAVIRKDGSLWTCGYNSHGQLGIGSDEAYSYTPVKIMSDVIAVSAGAYNAAAITSDGSLWMWGINKHGEFGNGANIGSSSPVKVMEDVAAVSVSDYFHTAVIKKDGSLWTFGLNQHGLLGDDSTTDKNIPVKIMEDVAAVAAGSTSTAAVKKDGSLWTWGENKEGQLGTDEWTVRHMPLSIMDGVKLPAQTTLNADAISMPEIKDETGQADEEDRSRVGEIAGNVYSTDIRAYINGVEVPSYNIGGRTAVVVEDVTSAHSYDDRLRTLLISGFSPDDLKGAAQNTSDTPGRITGNIYRTDIKTYIYDKELRSYNLGGRTAVVIEDLGGDQEFSDIGGKYIWNENDRTLNLEFMYDRFNAPNDAYAAITVGSDWLTAKADFKRITWETEEPSVMIIMDGMNERLDHRAPFAMPVFMEVNGEEKLLGYYFGHNTKWFYAKEDGATIRESNTEFTYFYDDVVKDAYEKAEIVDELEY